MGIFDSDFDMENYIRQRILELDQLENRELFKTIVQNSIIELYKHIKGEYDELERRVFDETPRAERLPDLITCVVSRDKYDVTDADMHPMIADDLNRVELNGAELIETVKSGREFYVYTCMIKADYLELKKLMTGDRRFRGVIENEYVETPAEFILKPNERYIRKAQEFYHIAKLNRMPWRSVNTAYLYKLFDVYAVSLEAWDDQLEVKKVTPEFDEFGDRILYEPLPIWNAREVIIKANAYPQPAVDRKYYEHYLYRKQFRADREYLLKQSDEIVRDIRRQAGDLYIICDSDLPGDWHFYEFSASPDPKNYENPLMSNEQNEGFSRNMIEYFGQRIKTRTEMIRFFKSFKSSEYLTFVDAKLKGKPRRLETYPTEQFIEYEYRTGDRNQTLELSFRPLDEDFYLNRDVMSFLVTEIQHLFPEYNCVGRLV